MTRFIDRFGTRRADSITIDVADNIQYTIYGYAGDDVLIAQGWNDVGTMMYGGAGNDFLRGGNTDRSYGGSWFDGGAGVDTMVGGVGGDTFHVGDRRDVVRDSTAGDDDFVWSTALYFELPKNVEHLYLDPYYAGPNENLSVRGNALANKITGKSSDANLLVGLAGDDTLDGGYGGVGYADTLTGGLGADYLTGSPDAIFKYNRSIESDTAHGIDRIRHMGDSARIDLFNVDANAATTGVNDSFVFIGTDAFSANATGQIRYEVLSRDRVAIYISTDADVEAEMEILLVSPPALTAENFIL